MDCDLLRPFSLQIIYRNDHSADMEQVNLSRVLGS